ncbi:MAG: hypothetical protein HY897_15925 [Deltaproteobacteria bacterium]|nr:hypothetical protein [Deltaproteobacteria bacterium]
MRRLAKAITVAAVLSATTVAWATETRVLTLGESNEIVKDEANILLYPSVIPGYGGMVFGEVGSNALYRLGAQHDMGKTWGVVGLYLDRSPAPVAGEIFRPPVDADGIDNRVNLFYGRSFGESFDAGISFAFFRDYYKVYGDPTDKSERDDTAFNIALGLSWDERLDLALGVLTDSWTVKDEKGGDVYKPNTNWALNLRGRYRASVTDEVDLIPHAGFRYGAEAERQPEKARKEATRIEYDAGLGVAISPVDAVLLLFDAGFNYHSDDQEYDPWTGKTVEMSLSQLVLPYLRVGLEGMVTDWLDLRLGAVKRWVDAFEDVTEEVSRRTGYSSMTTYLGAGLKFDRLTMDFMVDPGFFLRGPNFISGEAGMLNARASLKYAW